MPSGPIQTIPQGLLGLLQLKELGKNPAVLQDQVQPSYDLFQQYAQRNMLSAAGLFGGLMTTAALVNANRGTQTFTFSGANCQVPQNETWWVYQWTCLTNTINPADSISAAPEIFFAPSTQPHLVAPIYADVVNAETRAWISAPLVQPFWAPPNAIFGIYVTHILTATSITISGEMRAVRIPI